MDAGLDALQPAQQLGVVVERQPVVQAVDDVDLGDRLAGVDPGLQPPPGLVELHRVGAGVALLEAGERAEHAAGHADVGGVDVEVAVEVGAVAVQPLAHLVGQRADLQQVGVLVQGHAVLRGTAARPPRPCPGSRSSRRRCVVTAAPPRARRRRQPLAGRRPAPRINVAASLRVITGLSALSPRRSARSATIGPNSSSAPKPRLICARRWPSAVEVGHHVRHTGSSSRQRAKTRRVSRPSGSPSGVGINAAS